jgi:hypothetical protein
VSDRSRRLAIAGTLLIAVVLAACGDAAAAATPQPTPTPIPTPAGGEHLFTVANQQVALTLNLPPGWEADASSARRTASNGTELEISVWAPSAVYADPCHWQGTDVEVGPEVTDLVSALAAQPMRQARDATVDVAGIDAHRLFMSVPKSLDLATCDGGEFRSWLGSGPADARVESGPGQTDEVYVIEILGSAAVLDASYFDASTAELAEIHRIIQSLQLPPEPSPAPTSS